MNNLGNSQGNELFELIELFLSNKIDKLFDI